MSSAAKQLTKHVADIAAKTAKKLSPLTMGTVKSRNPDGSLNVDDGKGGCLRQAPAANVRVGQKIALGAEPGLGTQTNLPQVDLVLDPSTVPCPDDPRGCIPEIGVPCPKPVSGTYAQAATVFSLGWVDQAPYPTQTYANHRNGLWQNRLGPTGPAAGLVFNNGSNKIVSQSTARRTLSYTSHVDGLEPFADEVVVGSNRVFLSFNTSSIPTGATIISARVRVRCAGNTTNRHQTDDNETIVVLPSTHDGVAGHTSNWQTIDVDNILGRATIHEIIDAGPQPLADTEYDFEFALDEPGIELADFIQRGGTTKLALVTLRDALADSHLPAPGPIGTAALLVTPSGTPDDKAHMAGGNYDLGGVQYVAGAASFIFSQSSASGPLGAGESYYAGVSIGASGVPVVTKGDKGTSPRRPAIPTSNVLVSWIQCRQNGSLTQILSTDIEQAGARSFTSSGDPTKITSVGDRVTFTASSDIALIVTYRDDSKIVY